MTLRCFLAETLFGNVAATIGTLVAYLFLNFLEDLDSTEEHDGETTVATGVAIGVTATGENATGEEHAVVFQHEG